MIEAVKNFVGENSQMVLIAAVVAVLLVLVLVCKKMMDNKKKQRAIFSNSKNKYKSRLGKKNINKYIYKQNKKK